MLVVFFAGNLYSAQTAIPTEGFWDATLRPAIQANDDDLDTRTTLNDAKTGITTSQSNAIIANTAKVTEADTGTNTGDQVGDGVTITGAGTAGDPFVSVATGTPEGTDVLSTGEVGGVKFLREDGDGTSSWQVSSGSGDVNGPASATDTAIVVFDGSGGKTIKNSGILIDGSDNMADINSADFTAITAPAHSAGLLFYDTDDDELSFYNSISNVKLNLGSESWTKVRNDSGSTINDFVPVYQTGAVGNRATIAEAQADSGSTSMVLGVTTHQILNNENGVATWGGTINGVDTDGSPYGETWASGEEIFLSASTVGFLTNVAPTGDNIVVSIGKVLTAANNGSFDVKINGANVRGAASSTDNAIVAFDGVSGRRIQGRAPTINDTGEIDMGSQRITSVADPTLGTDAINRNYLDSTADIDIDYFFNDTASDIGGIYTDMTNIGLGAVESTITTVGLASSTNDQALNNYATLLGEPEVLVIPSGIFSVHFHAERTAGNSDVNIYAEVYKRASGGTETLIITTETSGLIVTKAEFELHANTLSDTDLLTTDRIIVKLFANVGGGSGATVAIYQEGTTVSRLSIPTTTDILSNIFIRVDGTNLPADTNYVTDAESVVIGNTSGTNTGDEGPPEGTAVLSTGEVGGTKYLREDGDGTSSWQTPAGSGDVTKVGTPVNDQVGVWTGDGTLEGDADMTFDGDNLTVTGTITAASGLASGATTTPTLSFDDSNSLDADETIARIFANATTVTAGAVVSDITFQYKDGGDASGAWTDFMIVDGSDNQVKFQINTTLQAGDIELAEMAANSVDYTKTTGSSKALTPVSGSTTAFAAGFTGANLYGGTYVVTSDTGDLVIPAMLINMHFTIITSGAIEVVSDNNAADGYLLDGVTGAEGANITNLSTSGDIACYQYYTVDDWLITTNGWTAE